MLLNLTDFNIALYVEAARPITIAKGTAFAGYRNFYKNYRRFARQSPRRDQFLANNANVQTLQFFLEPIGLKWLLNDDENQGYWSERVIQCFLEKLYVEMKIIGFADIVDTFFTYNQFDKDCFIVLNSKNVDNPSVQIMMDDQVEASQYEFRHYVIIILTRDDRLVKVEKVITFGNLKFAFNSSIVWFAEPNPHLAAIALREDNFYMLDDIKVDILSDLTSVHLNSHLVIYEQV